MKGVVLAGGKGTRLRPITHSMAKQLVPVANQPVLFYGLADLAAAGIEDVAIIVSPETADEVKAAVGDGKGLGIAPHYVAQESPDGLAAALALALPWVGDDTCVMYLGDNLVKGGVAGIVRDFEAQRPNCQIMLAEVDHPEQYGVAELAADGSITRLVEKPKEPPSNLALVGVYLFDPSIANAVANISPSARGELEITDAIQYLVDNGRDVRASVVDGWWKDTGRKEDLLHANELVLEDLVGNVKGEVLGGEIRGQVSVGEGSRLIDCSVTGPVVIGENTLIERAVIGPSTAIGHRCYLADCAIERAIVMDDVRIHEWKVRDGLIGNRAVLDGPAPDGYTPVTLGEHSEVGTQ
jgi:glucose-1-phosphate thymidylyltransferase